VLLDGRLRDRSVHGLDVARGACLPWAIGDDEACLVLGQAMPTMMTAALDQVKARGVRIAFDLVTKGGRASQSSSMTER
jgi:hypothetical protein